MSEASSNDQHQPLNFRGENLRGKNFEGQNLSGCDFSHTCIVGVSFKNAILREANFSNARTGITKFRKILQLFAAVFLCIFSGIILAVPVFINLPLNHPIFVLAAAVGMFLCMLSYLILGLFAGVPVAVGTLIGIDLFLSKNIAIVESVESFPTYVQIGTYIYWILISTDLKWANSHPLYKEKFPWARNLCKAFWIYGGTSFQGADLTNANFTSALLICTDFSNSTQKKTYLKNVNWRKSKRLWWAKLGDSILTVEKVRDVLISGDGHDKSYEDCDFREADLAEANFDRSNLKRADFSGARLCRATFQDACLEGANLTQADLNNANLYRANLKQAQLDGTDLTGATLTGAYIEDWGITTTTKLKDVQCEYAYMRMPTKENPNPLRKPDNLQDTFAEGEFADFIQPYFDTLDLYHRQDIDPRAISIAYKKLSENHPQAQLEIVAMEKRGQNSFNLKLHAAATTNKSELSSEYFADYNQLKLSPEKRLLLLVEKDNRIRSLEQMIQTALYQPNFNVENLKIMTENQGPTYQTTVHAQYLNAISTGSGNIQNATQNIGATLDEVTKLIQSLKTNAQAFPEAQKIDIEIFIEDLESDLADEKKRQPGRLAKRLLALWGAVCLISGHVAGVTDFTNNVLELSEKLRVPFSTEIIQQNPHIPHTLFGG